MINIVIDDPLKLKDNILVKKSAFVTFDYDAKIVEYMQGLSTRVYNPADKEWEMPVENLIGFCNKFENDEIKITGRLENLHRIEKETEIPSSYKFKTKPYAHQLDGIKFGLNKKKFLLCDDQGLGKTKQIIDLVGCIEQNEPINKVLIICGVNALKYNWQEEIEKHSDKKGWVLGTRYRKNGKMYEGSSKDKLADLDNIPDDCQFIITNIETLRAGAEKVTKTKYAFPIAEKIKELCDSGVINMVAFDECHKAKNVQSLQGRAMKIIKAEYMVAMSGTPLMNNPLDLYFPLHWLGYETHSFYQFKQHYCRLGGWGGSEVIGFKNLDEIRQIMEKVMLRRLKTEVLDLPEKVHQTEYVEMGRKQQLFYDEVHAGIIKDINKIKFSNNPLSMLIRLRQATGYTGIISDTVTESAKLKRMEELVDEITASGQKCIIFSNWSSVTDEAKARLTKYKPAYITGETKSEERLAEVARFQEDDSCKVIIGTIGAMGTGLTLTAAQTVLFLDSPWNRALKDQAEDRAHRIGTKGTVNVITLVTKDTIDERIEEIVYKKGLISDSLVDGKVGMDIVYKLLS